MKVQIDRRYHPHYWYYAKYDQKREPDEQPVAIEQRDTYPQIVRAALAAGHDIVNAGWKRKMLSWNFTSHSLDGYPEWEIETERSPAFVKLTHTRGSDGSDVESSALANAWDDIAQVDFYQRDWTDDGIPFVREGETYWSGWWFATIAERDRFVQWHKNRLESQKETR